MNVLKKCCYRSLKENPKRTVVTIVGIILATALITAVACVVVSFRASMVAYEKKHSGDFHYQFTGVDPQYLRLFENNQYVEKYGLTDCIGYAMLEGSRNKDKPYVYISAMDENAREAMSLQLTEGRMPQDDTELLISRHIRSNALVDWKVGDRLTLSVGDRQSEGFELTQETPYLPGEEVLENRKERTYTVVGIAERPNLVVEPRIAPGYSVFTRLEEPEKAKKLDVYASYTKKGLKQAEQVNAGILGISENLYSKYYTDTYMNCTEKEIAQVQRVAFRVTENYWLLKWELLIFSSGIMNMMYSMSAVAITIIIVTSVFCIHNSFTISLTEKMKMYGRLSSVGTTGKQQRKMVYYEASFLGLVGIPLGICSGIAATAILVNLTSILMERAMGVALVFGISWSAVLLAALLSVVTIFLSASRSARRAAKISPINAIRSNDTVKIGRKELRCPGFVEKMFGIGGRIAYKNLRRARVKYRTTVVSIVISVAVFIGMSTFVQLLDNGADMYYENMAYQLRASIYQWDFYQEALRIAGLDGVQEAEVVRQASMKVETDEIDYTEDYIRTFGVVDEIRVCSLGEEGYVRFCEKSGVSVEEARDKAIVLAEYEWDSYDEDGKRYVGDGTIAEFQKGDVLRGTGDAEDVEIEVLAQRKEGPMYYNNGSTNRIVLVVSDQWMDAHPQLKRYDNIEVCVKCEDAYEIEQIIRYDIGLQHFTVTNYEEQRRADQSMRLLIAIFLYGFITVVALIGITNIFNTITTNMELRAPEFAMLQSVGMTKREFRRMIWLEGMFYGGKALIIGIPMGILLSFCFNKAFERGIVTEFIFPWLGILMSILAVVLLLYVIMHYSMSKIKKRNIIETIQNENI